MFSTPRLSRYNPRERLAIIDSAETVLALLKRHMKWREGKAQAHGRGGIKAALSKRIMAQVICVYIAAAKFIFYYSRHCISPIDNSFQMCAGVPGVSERHLQARRRDSQPGSHLSLSPLLFSLREQPFHHSDSGRERGFLTVLLCKYSTFWMSDVCSARFYPSIMPEGHCFSPLLEWLEEVKRHLAADGLHFRQALLVFFLPYF